MSLIYKVPGFSPTVIQRDRDLREVHPPVIDRLPELSQAQKAIVKADQAKLDRLVAKQRREAQKQRKVAEAARKAQDARDEKARVKAYNKQMGYTWLDIHEEAIMSGIINFVWLIVIVGIAVMAYAARPSADAHNYSLHVEQCNRYNDMTEARREQGARALKIMTKFGGTKEQIAVYRKIAITPLENCEAIPEP